MNVQLTYLLGCSALDAGAQGSLKRWDEMAGHDLPHLGDYRYTIEADYNGSKVASNLSPNENFTTSHHAVCYREC